MYGDFDEDQNYNVVSEGPYSTLYLADEQEDCAVVVKRASAFKQFTKEPHDIMKEVHILKSLHHPHIISILDNWIDIDSHLCHFRMPFLPFSLHALLCSPFFSPQSPPTTFVGTKHPLLHNRSFDHLARSIVRQLFSALAYLHHPSRKIAHRDIKPANILISGDAQVKLIDFGVSYDGLHTYIDKEVIWPESDNRMYFEVATGPYRAPELLLGARTYDPFATDLWSAGCTLSEFFRPLRLLSIDSDDEPESVEDDLTTLTPYILPPHPNTQDDIHPSEWERLSLFSADRGEIGLLWSIFKIRGTPTNESWPEYNDLMSTMAISFNVVPKVDLRCLLPHLPNDEEDAAGALDLLDRLLTYQPSSRIKAQDVLSHQWLRVGAES